MTSMKRDSKPTLPTRRRYQDEVPCGVVEAMAPSSSAVCRHEDDGVSVLSFDVTTTDADSLYFDSVDTRFETPSSPGTKSDSTPQRPARSLSRRASYAMTVEPPLEVAQSKYDYPGTPTRRPPVSYSANKLDEFLQIVNHLGDQISEIKDKEAKSASAAADDVQEQLQMLRQQLEEERRLRQRIEEKLIIERDVSSTAKAELALKEVVEGMRLNMARVQQQNRIAQQQQLHGTRLSFPPKSNGSEMGEEIMACVQSGRKKSCRKTGGKHRRKSTSCKSNSCYTIPELQSVGSEFSMGSSLQSDTSVSQSSLSLPKKTSSRLGKLAPIK